MMNGNILTNSTMMRVTTVVGFLVSLLVVTFMTQAAPSPTQKHGAGSPPEPTAMSVLVQSDRPVGRHLFDDWYVVQVTAADQDNALHVAKQMPGVRAAESDAQLQMHQAACPPAEWFIENVGQFGKTNSVGVDTDAWEAWKILRAVPFPIPIRIAVVDSGVNVQHERFRGVTIYARKKFADDIRSVGDVYGHGTPVAGTITAMLPDPSWYELGSYRVFTESGSTTYSTLISALEAAVSDGSKIINFSGGIPEEPSVALYTFIESHPDVLFVFSAGNFGLDAPEYPARYHDLPNVISVAAIDQSGALTPWTNTGALLAAPGQYIFTSMCTCQLQPITICQPAEYGFLPGTSFAAPIVAAASAGRMVLHPEETPAQVREALLMSVQTDPRYRNRLISQGRLNFHSFLEIH